ncbi:hypothetical protein ACEN9H_08450 [Massilia cellulosiltytica]|uniref:hypothetical protein n=1 Tax=Massilia cellulosiltytica TaxID=2683234 RepID=UPI0039B6483F
MRSQAMVLMCVLVLAGCAAPKVQYELNPTGKVTAPRFQRADSLITFAYPTKQGAVGLTTDPSTVQITSVPVEYTAETWSIAGTRAWSNWGVSTLLQVTHRPNTLLLQEVGSQVIDKRVEALDTIGKIIGSGIAIMAAGAQPAGGEYRAPEPTSLLLIVRTGHCTSTNEKNEKVTLSQEAAVPARAFVCDQVPLKGNYWVAGAAGLTNAPFTGKFIVDAVPSETTPASELQKSFASDSIFYSACRNVRVELTNTLMSNQPMAEVRVSDPAHIEWLGLPDKGKIIFGSSCGADIVAEDANLPTSVDLINAAIGSAAAIKKAKEGK